MPYLSGGRRAAMCLLASSIVYGVAGSRIQYAFSSDPLGPRVFPVMLAIALAVFSMIYLARPGDAPNWPRGNLLAQSVVMIGVLVASALVLESLGFAAAMFLLCLGIGRLFGASWKAALVGSGVQAALWYFVFDYLLDVYLPVGDLLKNLWS